MLLRRPPPAVAITVSYGDGVGPEIMEAVLDILRDAEAWLSIEVIEAGQRIYDMQSHEAMLPSAWEKLHRTKILLQGPVSEPEERQSLYSSLRHRMNITEGYRVDTPHGAADVHMGEGFIWFTPAHGTQAELGGTGNANPASMLLAAMLLLQHIGQHEAAARVQRALFSLPPDHGLGTAEFTQAILERLWN